MDKTLEPTESLSELLILVSSYTDEQKELIRSAYNYANKRLSNEKRLGGSSYMEHALNVAGYLAKIDLDPISVASGLLHDVIDKSETTLDEIDKEFGTDIAFIVDGLSTMRKMSQNTSKNEKEMANFKNLIFNATEDIRVLIVRLAEKVDNISTIGVLDHDKMVDSANKALNIYAPLAEYLNLAVFQRVLEDEAFKVLLPYEYQIINDYIASFFTERHDQIDEYTKYLSDLLQSYNISNFEIKARRKGIFSAFKKIKGKYLKPGEKLNIEAVRKLPDLFASRIIVDTVEQCYVVLGLLNSVFETFTDEFDDYIANPKANGYKSIHTLLSFKGTVFEAQIRTKEMHELNEFGPASHIAYKLKSAGKGAEGSYTWTKDLVKWQGNTAKDNFKIKAFSESIFVFSPKGTVVRLDKGSKPLDFAFKIHTTLGYKYIGAKVNGKMVNMNHELQTGDIVEIITGSKENVTLDWLKSVQMTETKSRIRRKLNRVN